MYIKGDQSATLMKGFCKCESMAPLSEEAVLEEINRSNRPYPVSEDYNHRALTHPTEDIVKSTPEGFHQRRRPHTIGNPQRIPTDTMLAGTEEEINKPYIRRIQQRTQSDTTSEVGNENNTGSFFLVGIGNLLFTPSKTLFTKNDSVSEIRLMIECAHRIL
jgi:hypothetical protein